MYEDKLLPLVKSAHWDLELHQADDDDDVASDPGCVDWAKQTVLKGLTEAIQQYKMVKNDPNEDKLIRLVSNIDATNRFTARFDVDN